MNDQEPKKVLKLGAQSGPVAAKPKLELKKPAGDASGATGSVRQSFSHGRSKTVAVEVRRRRVEGNGDVKTETLARAGEVSAATGRSGRAGRTGSGAVRSLTQEERDARMRALRGAVLEQGQKKAQAAEAEEEAARIAAETEVAPASEDDGLSDRERLRRREMEELKQIQDQERSDSERRKAEDERRARATTSSRSTSGAGGGAVAQVTALARRGLATSEDDDDGRARRGRGGAGRGRGTGAGAGAGAQKRGSGGGGGGGRRAGRLTVTQALSDGDDTMRQRSVASMRRRIEREKRQAAGAHEEQTKVTRDVIVPEVITVQELANRMAERGVDVIKALMKMGVMATITQSIDADTAELIASEFGHRVKRVTEADVEANLSVDDVEDSLVARAPVVTVMGHVDHGKTSLLDAMRQTAVAAGEAGGITQHIGAYQVVLPQAVHGFDRITFIDTPGHAAFTEMRARGANVTDIVVLVVAADDGIMPQTIEAIRHAKAANVPMIVAINKCDLPAANPGRVRQELLQHDVQVEEMGGEVLSVELSAKKRTGLDKLEEAILLQAEILDLKANPDRAAEGAIIEAKMERGRGSVATVLVQRGTLKVGDIYVAGSEWGRVRALIDDRGETVTEAGPAKPVEVLGLSGTPVAGDDLIVVESEARAREISEFRQHRRRTRAAAAAANQRGTLEQMMQTIKAGEVQELPLLIKGDVHGSVEALKTALVKLSADNAEVKVRVLDAAVGPITESDVTLANASRGLIIGFNVRANPQAREMAKRDAVEVRYYNVIYNVIDDVKQALSGMLAPELREKFLGNAAILQVFSITRVGKVAGCKVTEGIVKRGAKVRLLRDNVVIHEGTLKTLKRMKDEVKEVREGYECGMAFENYDNIQENDVIECFDVEEVARSL